MQAFETRYLYSKIFAAFFTSLEAWSSVRALTAIPEQLTQQEYDDLLRGTDADCFIPLWASAAKGEGHPLMDETTYAFISFCKEHGYSPARIDGNPEDYIGSQLEALAHFYACAAVDEAYLDAAAFLEDRFLADTIHAYAQALRSYRQSGEAIEVLALLEAFLAGNLSELPDNDKTRALLRDMAKIKPQPPLPVEQPHIINSAGINNCGGKCKINITVAEGCALEISTDDSDNDPQIRACLRGRGYRRTFLTPKRLRYPMKRVGERGSGKFARISWEEAARIIAEKTREVGKKYGPEARYFLYATGNCGVMRPEKMLKRLVNLDGGFLNAYNSYSSACSTYVSPYIYGDASGGNSEADVLNSKLIILWGHNPSETIFGSLHNYYLAQAKAKGIPIVVIDPRMSDTALSLSEEWIPLRPTTDGALCDAIAYTIIKMGLHDLAFLHKFCVGFDEETLPAGAPAGSSYLNYLDGSQDGIVKDAAWAEPITGVPAYTIVKLADRLATAKPAMIIPGFGPQRHANGEQETRGIAALACITGNVGKSGGGSGLPRFAPPRPAIAFPVGEDAYPGYIPTFLWSDAVFRAKEMDFAHDGLKYVDHLRSNIKLIYNIAGNTLINQHSDINRTIRILKDESLCELIVTSDLFMTASARWSDLILPAASVLESNNVTMGWCNDDYLLSNSRAVQPLFGTMPDYDWICMIADAMGYGEAFRAGHKTTEDWILDLYNTFRQTKETELPPYEQFRENGGYKYKNPPLRIAYREQIEKGVPFHTPSGKIEFYSMQIHDLGDPIPPIPRYTPAPEGPDDALREKYPLQMIGYHTKRRCHSIHDQNPWLEEVDPPALWMHPDDAAARGIANGDMIEVFNDRGTVRIPAKVTRRIMRGVTCMSQGGWYTPDKKGVDTRGSINVLTGVRPTPLAKGNPQHTNLVEVRKAVE